MDPQNIVAQLHIAAQLENAYDFGGGLRFQERDDAFDLPECQFVKLFRLKKETAERVINIVEENSTEPSRSSALDATVQVLTALRFFASGSYQNCIGSNVNMAISQPSVSRCIHNVTNILNLPQIFDSWIHFPRNIWEAEQLRNRFWVEHRFPGVIGCIDCTHICDPDLKIINVNARYSGSTHDSYIWNNSDSGYALRPWLMTPVGGDEDDVAVQRYNSRQRCTRSLIERCNGLWKMRFHCLLKHRVLYYQPDVCSRIINACAVLHNMCIQDNCRLDPEEEEEELDFGMFDNAINEAQNIPIRNV
ncbi:putative nuclease HARBI1, partial [Orussus abietinus]|uniref:putative nuclease HARBI1 n=1 Tax=Orussus abietinus TaxID=222816 RepID=UPI000C715E62